MKTFYTPGHQAHAPKEEFEAGRLAPAVEVPERAERVRARIEARRLGPILPPGEFGNEPALRVHDPAFVQFLTDAYGEWRGDYPQRHCRRPSLGLAGARPAHAARRRHRSQARLLCFRHRDADHQGQLAGGACRRQCGAQRRAGDPAWRDQRLRAVAPAGPSRQRAIVFGGYCYLNNVAIAAQWLADEGLRPAILDVDYHHGNGTQAIFYDRADVLFVSIHASPEYAYPHFLGFADERGQRAPARTPISTCRWRAGPTGPAMPRHWTRRWRRVRDFGPDVLLVSLGLDTFEGDPICALGLKTQDYLRLGERLATLGKPTLFVFEGGYNLEHLAENTVNVLEGFLSR